MFTQHTTPVTLPCHIGKYKVTNTHASYKKDVFVDMCYVVECVQLAICPQLWCLLQTQAGVIRITFDAKNGNIKKNIKEKNLYVDIGTVRT